MQLRIEFENEIKKITNSNVEFLYLIIQTIFLG